VSRACAALATAERPAVLDAPPGHPAPPLVFIVGPNPAKVLLIWTCSYTRVGTRSGRRLSAEFDGEERRRTREERDAGVREGESRGERTSASSSARRMSFMGALMFSAVSCLAPFSWSHAFSSPVLRLSKMSAVT